MTKKVTLKKLYGTANGHSGNSATQRERYDRLAHDFAQHFSGKPPLRFFSAPGRIELGGNHTDHNRGEVLAAAITPDTIAAVLPTDDDVITLYSNGYRTPFIVNTTDLVRRPNEHSTIALIRGICARLHSLGAQVGGFSAEISSQVQSGSGLSSSAAFEVLVCVILDCLYNGGQLDSLQIAQICRWAENNYMGKQCGLMDQTASSSGGLVHIDFKPDTPDVRRIDFDFAAKGYCIAIVATGASHSDLTTEYDAIPSEMLSVATALGGAVLSDVSSDRVQGDIKRLREVTGDRAVLRALHFFDENERVSAMVQALSTLDIRSFFHAVVESGESSWKLLQNVYINGTGDQSLSIALELCRRFLAERGGAWRVHGGGFAGTILAFVPQNLIDEFSSCMNGVFGNHACSVLAIRPFGAVEVSVEVGIDKNVFL